MSALTTPPPATPWRNHAAQVAEVLDTDVPVLRAEEALVVARALAGRFAPGAAARDADRRIPVTEYRELAASGLLALTVPAEHGGPDLRVRTVTEVFRTLAEADPSLAQLPHSHYVYVNALRHRGTPAQRRFFFDQVRAGRTFGNAQSEVGTRHVREHRTTLYPTPGGRWRLEGEKAYATGALVSDWIPVLAHRDVDGPMHVAWVQRTATGVEVVDDWDGMGQRTTASGTVRLTGVDVAPEMLMEHGEIFADGPQTYGAFAQVLHAAIDAGIARGALDEAAGFVTTRSRPHPDAGVTRHADDPLVQHAFGEMELAVRAAEALLAQAARAVDEADLDLTPQTAAAASLATAAARAATSSAAVEVSSRLFEVAGTRASLHGLNLHRHWRNARTHTLHDPAAWKVQHLGRHALDGTLPPAHGQL